MSSNLSSFVDKLVTIITTDGRLLVGHLRGYDQTTNLILSAAQERTISPDEPCTTEDLGLYILRGDNVALVGETEEEKDQSIDWYFLGSLATVFDMLTVLGRKCAGRLSVIPNMRRRARCDDNRFETTEREDT
jgi:U6 snRNA-associated Sm-like protein LSm8